jgi:hypothetical protein
LSEKLLQAPFGVTPSDESFAYSEVFGLLTTIGTSLNTYASFLRGSQMLMEVWDEDNEFRFLLETLSKTVDKLEDDSTS